MVKIDNHNPAAKLALRRHFLDRYHSDGSARVLDCCQGGGLMWRELRKTHEVASYWALDLKPKKGRLKLDSVRVLQQPGWNQNVIDVDVYSSPWAHWQVMLPNITQPTTVFLTRGSHSLETLNKHEKKILGLTFSSEIPVAFWPKLQLIDMAVRYCATTVCAGIILTEAVEAVSDGNARYIGCRVEPMKTPAPEVETPKRAEPKRTKKESSHV